MDVEVSVEDDCRAIMWVEERQHVLAENIAYAEIERIVLLAKVLSRRFTCQSGLGINRSLAATRTAPLQIRSPSSSNM